MRVREDLSDGVAPVKQLVKAVTSAADKASRSRVFAFGLSLLSQTSEMILPSTQVGCPLHGGAGLFPCSATPMIRDRFPPR